MRTEVNGININYEKTGKGEQSIVLLHGNGEDHTMFYELSQLLAKDFTVYALDSRGHGESDPVDSLTYDEMAEDVVSFIKKKKIKHPILYGFSDGGILGLLIAIRHPGLISKLIVSGANLKPTGLKNWFLRQCELDYEANHSPLIELMLNNPNISHEELHTIHIPTLILAGEDDLVKEAHTESIHRNIENSQMQILAGEGHDTYVIHNPKLYDVMAPFLFGE
ncbi:MAG: alpha/beta hydrolase [Candidatus Riflebacteria bacterium]|nr:alpha/beta hydrolase [Candidatus Riflebacteria bacterium]